MFDGVEVEVDDDLVVVVDWLMNALAAYAGLRTRLCVQRKVPAIMRVASSLDRPSALELVNEGYQSARELLRLAGHRDATELPLRDPRRL